MGEKILAQLERLAYWLQRRRIREKIAGEFISPYFAFFHSEDKSQRILNLYQIRLAKLLGKKIVLVTGCFDLLHQEHLKFLKKAKKEGDALIVGLESDERVRKMKGKGRPINSFKIRVKNLVRLNEVDFVLRLPDDFGNQSVRLETLRLIKPNLLAISSNDPLEEKKRKECKKISCKVKVVYQYNPEISTTKFLLDKKEFVL